MLPPDPYGAAPGGPMETLEVAMRRWAYLLIFLVACKTTPDGPPQDPDNPDAMITVSAKELEPIEEFVFKQAKVLVAPMIRVEMSTQYFEERVAVLRDFRYVEKRESMLPDGTRTLVLTNINEGQKTNIDPSLLPQISFGQGLQIRAYERLVLFVRPSRDKNRPIYLHVQAVGHNADVQMWSGGKLRFDGHRRLSLQAELIWDEDWDRYRFRGNVG